MQSYVNNLKINNLYYKNIDTRCRKVVDREEYISAPIVGRNYNYNTIDYNKKKFHKPKIDAPIVGVGYIHEPNRTLISLDPQNNPYNYDNDEFWNKKFDYNNLVDEEGYKVHLIGVCNPLLLDSCENIQDKDNVPMNGLCNTENLNKNTFYFNIDTDMDLSNNYKINNENEFNISNSHKLESGQKISDSIIDKEEFAIKYCRTGEFEIKDNEYFCL
jgi:hypothetical protein